MADPYWANVVFLAGFEGASPEDESSLAQTVTAYGGSAVSSAEAKYGSKSLALPTSGFDAGVSVPDHANMAIAGQDFTIEGWINFSALMSGNYVFASQYEDALNQASWKLELLDTGADTFALRLTATEFADFSGGADSVTASNFTYTTDVWYHIACDFDGSTYRLYVDGVMLGSEAGPWFDFANATSPLCVGLQMTNGFPNGAMLNAYLDEVRITVGVARYATGAGFTPPTGAFERDTGLDTEIEEGVELSGTLAPATFEIVPEGMEVAQLLTPGFPRSLTDGVRVFLHGSAHHAVTVSIADTITVTPTEVARVGVVILQRLGLLETVLANSTRNLSLADGVALADALKAGTPVVLADTVTVTEVALARQAVRILEALGLTETILPNSVRGLSISDALALADSMGRFFGGEIVDAFTAGDTISTRGRARGALAETVTVTHTAVERLLMRATLAEDLDITHEEVLQAFYTGTIEDGIEIAGGFILPGGGLTTWTMNTKTGAVSEYDNYEFNSFATVGSRYLGASSTGLYELLGEDDAGDDIVARIKSGLLQFGGTHLSRLKAAYIATRGEGDFVMRIETGHGETYDYAVSTRDMRSTKVHMGKGQRARYFSFELISAGQDFDLDTLEFVPVVVQRRV